jgi:hypothetical protein
MSTIQAEEVRFVPLRDGTGPLGLGAMTGRCFGLRHGMGMGYGFGSGSKWGFGRRMRRNFPVGQKFFNSTKEFLEEQKKLLQSRLDAIDRQLNEY